MKIKYTICKTGHQFLDSRDNVNFWFADTIQGFTTSHKKNYRKVVKQRAEIADKEETIRIKVPLSRAEEVYKILDRKPGNRAKKEIKS